METKEFINNFADQFDDTELDVFTIDIRYRDLDEWSSLNALAIMNMIEKKYGVSLKPEEMKQTETILELLDFVKSKKS